MLLASDYTSTALAHKVYIAVHNLGGQPAALMETRSHELNSGTACKYIAYAAMSVAGRPQAAALSQRCSTRTTRKH
eukprot:5558-Heterococcus_DN1.PRE.3